MIEGLQQTNISLSRGIVRTPSLGEDGELSECVNLIPHKGEIVRIKEPQPLTEDATGLYLYYTLLIEEGVLYFMAAEPLPENLPVVVNYKGGTATFEVLKDTDFHSIAFVGNEDDITSIEIGNKAFYDSLGKKILKGYKLFIFLSPQEVVFPWPNQLTKMPVELQADEILLATNRCADKENLIVRCVDKLAYYRSGKGRHEITQLGTGEVEIITIGQTLVVSQGTTKRYFVWNDEGYKEQDLLNVMPKAKITLGDNGFIPMTLNANSKSFDCHKWSAPKMRARKDGDTIRWTPDGNKDDLAMSLWGAYNKQRNIYKEAGAHCFPFHIRWGVLLYDDSIVNLSAPILMTPSSFVRPYVSYWSGQSEEITAEDKGVEGVEWVINFIPRYLYAGFDASDLKGIGDDLIKAIVVFATSEIDTVDNEANPWDKGELKFVKNNETLTDALGWHNQYNEGGSSTRKDFDYSMPLPVKDDTETLASRFNDPIEFYQLATIPWDIFRENNFKVYTSVSDGTFPANGGTITIPMSDTEPGAYAQEGYRFYRSRVTLDALTSQPSLTGYNKNQSNYVVQSANASYAYNSRLFYGGVNVKRPHLLYMSQFVADCRLPYLRNKGGVPLSAHAKLDGAYLTLVNDSNIQGYRGETPFIAFPYDEAEGVCLIEQPKSRALTGPTYSPGGGEVTPVEGNLWASIIALKKHTSSIGGYASWSAITPYRLREYNDLKDFYPSRVSSVDSAWLSDNYSEISALTYKPNTIAYTKVANPWIIERQVELACGEIYALSSSTEAISEGQFGEFPLYAFTSNGIYALYIDADGGIEAKQASSRDVLIPTSKVLQLDRALVFATEAGLKILSKPPTQSISDELSGLNIRESDFGVNPNLYLEDALPFEEQIRNARMVYDYANQRIHVFDDHITGSKKEMRGWAEGIETKSETIEEENQSIVSESPGPSGYIYCQSFDYTEEEQEITIASKEGSVATFKYIPLKAGDRIEINQRDNSLLASLVSEHYMWLTAKDNLIRGDKISVLKVTGDSFVAGADCLFTVAANVINYTLFTTGTITREETYTTQIITPYVSDVYRQKHYVYDIETQQWASQILDKQLTTVVQGYPFSTMQFGNQLMQYNNALEADVVKPGWLLTRPIALNDPWVRKMIADVRIMAQKTHQDSKLSLAIYTSEDRVNWHRLNSLKSRSAKWYRFLIKVEFCGQDLLSGLTIRWAQRLGNKMK